VINTHLVARLSGCFAFGLYNLLGLPTMGVSRVAGPKGTPPHCGAIHLAASGSLSFSRKHCPALAPTFAG
jgi:hypothetical protein